MNHTEFFNKLKVGYIARGYLFTGTENYVKHEALRTLEKKFLPEGLEPLNENILEGKTADDVISACETLPMMAERRLVVVRDFAPLMPGNSKGEKEESAQLSEYLNKLPETCCLVMYMRANADGRKTLYKAFADTRSCQIVDFSTLSDHELNTWIAARFKRAGKLIRDDVISQLVFRAGSDLTRLSGEIEKICSHAGSNDSIDINDLDVVTPTLECNVFNMIDMLVTHKPQQVYSMLQVMLEQGEDEVRVLAMITRQIRFMMHIKLMDAKKPKPNDNEIMKALGISQIGLRNTRRQLTRFTQDRLITAYNDCIDTEFAIKNGAMTDEEGLGRLLLKWLDTQEQPESKSKIAR